MIQLVLRDPMKHVPEVVPLARDGLAQPFAGKTGDGAHQGIVGASGQLHGPAPFHFAGLGNRRKIFRALELALMTGESLQSRSVPCADVQHELPDAMHAGQGFGSRSRRVNVCQQLHEGGPVPGAAVKGASKLIGNASGFRNSRPSFSLHRCPHSPATIATPAASAASLTFRPSSSRHFPASTARQVAPAARITSIVFTPITGTSNRIS